MALYGTDLLDSTGVLTNRQFAERKNHRYELTIDAHALDTEWMQLRANAAIIGAQLPNDTVRTSFDLDEVPSWTDRRYGKIGLSLDALNDRLHYTGSFAWSSFEHEWDHLAAKDREAVAAYRDLGLFDDEKRDARAEHHKLEAALLQRAPVSASISASYTYVDRWFLTMQPTTDTYFPSRWVFSRDPFYRRDREVQEVGAKLGYGPVSLAFATGIESRPSRPDRRAQFHRMNLEVELEEHRSSEEAKWPALERLLPSALRFYGRHDTWRPTVDAEGPNTENLVLGVGSEWYWEAGITSVELWHSSFASTGTEYQDAKMADVAVDLSQSISGKDWSMSINFSVGQSNYDEIGSRSRDLSYGAGLFGSYAPGDWPRLFASVSVNQNQSEFPDYDEEQSFRYVGFTGSLDFSDLLSEAGFPNNPYLKLTYRARRLDRADTIAGKRSNFDHAVLLSGGIRF